MSTVHTLENMVNFMDEKEHNRLKKPQLEGGKAYGQRRVCVGLDEGAPPRRLASRLRSRTSLSNGKEAGALFAPVRSSAPQERNQERQQSLKPSLTAKFITTPKARMEGGYSL